jgi:hypothetical protein
MDMTTKYISVPNEVKREIKTIFGCSREFVWWALNYKSDSDLAQRIRKFALDKGGVEYDSSKQNFTNLSN